MTFDVVIPTAGRESLGRLLRALAGAPGRVIVVDDRAQGSEPLDVPDGVDVLLSGGRGPATARNVGWRASSAPWVAFLDDDVVPQTGWSEALGRELADLGRDVAGSQGRVRVPLRSDRPPTDWERNVAGLEHARWATADMAYRRSALATVGGFDERFPRAYREDADLGVRITARGWRIVRGERFVTHPVGPSNFWTSLKLQRGNADDVFMRALHGPDWRDKAGAPAGRLKRHVATTGAGVAALAVPGRRARVLCSGLWALGTAELSYKRIAPGPKTAREIFTMLVTSALMTPVATFWHLYGRATVRSRLAQPGPRPERPKAVLLDRDGTLVVDVPYNGDPERVKPMPGARRALDRLRAEGVQLAVISNQSGVGRGLISSEQVSAVNTRVEQLLGPIGPWLVCPHAPDDGCDCRKPRPGLVLRAAEVLGVDPESCAVVGDIGADVEAARAAGARPVLVPTARTRAEEVAEAEETASDLEAAVDRLLGEVR